MTAGIAWRLQNRAACCGMLWYCGMLPWSGTCVAIPYVTANNRRRKPIPYTAPVMERSWRLSGLMCFLMSGLHATSDCHIRFFPALLVSLAMCVCESENSSSSFLWCWDYDPKRWRQRLVFSMLRETKSQTKTGSRQYKIVIRIFIIYRIIMYYTYIIHILIKYQQISSDLYLASQHGK